MSQFWPNQKVLTITQNLLIFSKILSQFLVLHYCLSFVHFACYQNKSFLFNAMSIIPPLCRANTRHLKTPMDPVPHYFWGSNILQFHIFSMFWYFAPPWMQNMHQEKKIIHGKSFYFRAQNLWIPRYQNPPMRGFLVRALFLTFPLEKTTFQLSKVVFEAIFPTN